MNKPPQTIVILNGQQRDFAEPLVAALCEQTRQQFECQSLGGSWAVVLVCTTRPDSLVGYQWFCLGYAKGWRDAAGAAIRLFDEVET